jgi:DNA-binding MarR family transcriptional regulator
VQVQEVELLGKYFSRIYRFSKTYQDQELKHLGIGSGQFGFMMILLRTEGISQSKLSEISKLDKTTIARSIRPLIENDYVVRGKDPDDRRGYKLLLTDSGRSLGPELIRIQMDLERQLLENFTSEEIELLSGFLRRMNENASKLK